MQERGTRPPAWLACTGMVTGHHSTCLHDPAALPSTRCSPARSPLSSLLHAPVSPLPLPACLAINAWLVLLFVVVLPLCALHPLERRARRQFWAESVRAAREAAEASGASADAVAAAARTAATRAPPPPQVGAFPLSGAWAIDLYLYSTATWALAVAAFAPPGD